MRIILSYITICFILSPFALLAQVGINTQNPQGVLHIDGKANNPTSNTDDVYVDSNGNMGIGSINTLSAKLHIIAPSGTTALRIEDGTQVNGRVLMSDANGNASWGSIRASGGSGVEIRNHVLFPNSKDTSVPLRAYDKEIRSNGNYLVTIRWWGRTTATTQFSSAYFFLYKNNVLADGIEYYIYIAPNEPFTFTTVLVAANCITGDQLDIKIRPSIGGKPWEINGLNSLPPSITITRM